LVPQIQEQPESLELQAGQLAQQAERPQALRSTRQELPEVSLQR
jgi:hypothetical protein